MKKRFIVFGIVMILALFVIGFASSQTCTDSDNGLNYEEKGIVNGLEAEGIFDDFTDYCGFAGEEEEKLVEYTCETDNSPKKNLYSCPVQCSNGKCVNEKLSDVGVTKMQVAYCSGHLSCNIFTSKSSCESASEEMKEIIKNHPEFTFTSNLLCEWNEETSSCEKEISCAFLHEEECKNELASTCSWKTYSSWERFTNFFKRIFGSRLTLS